MTHRRSRASAVALLTVILALVLCAAAWAQDGDEPVSSEEPTTQAAGEVRVGGDAEVVGGESGADNCAIRSVGDDEFEFDRCEESNRAVDETSGGSNRSDDFEDDGAVPSGSVDSGYGPVAPTREAGLSLPLVGAGVGLLLVVGLGAARLRRAG